MNQPFNPSSFIDGLVGDLKPVRRPPGVLAATLLWTLASTGIALAIVAFFHFRPDLAAELENAPFLFSSVLLFGGAVALSALAFRSGVPGRDFVARSRTGIVALAGVIVVFYLALAARESADLPVQVGLNLQGYHCSVVVGILSVLPGIGLLFALKKKYAAVRPRYSGRLLGAAAGLLGAALMGFHCPVNEAVHLLVWHALPVLLISWAFSWIATRFLRF
jgi:hypothetical protein